MSEDLRVDWHILTIDGEPVLSPKELAQGAAEQGFPADFWGRANRIELVIGMEPGTATLVVPRATMDAISVNDLHTLYWQYSRGGGTPRTTTFENWVICDARIVGIDGDEKAAYVLELRDARQILKHAKIVNKNYNLSVTTACAVQQEGSGGSGGSGEAYYCKKDYPDGGGTYTWQNVLDDLWGYLPGSIAGPPPTLPWAPPHLPESWRFRGVQAWEAIGQILDACQTTLKPVAGGAGFECVDFGTAQGWSWGSISNRLLRDEKPKDPCRCFLPAVIRITFPSRLCDPCTFSTPAAWQRDPVILSDAYATGLSCAQPNSEMGLRYDLIADVDCDQNPFNGDDLALSAAAIASQVSKRMAIAREFGKDFSGICHEAELGSEVHHIVYRDYGDDLGCITEVYGYAAWGIPKEAWTKPIRDYPNCNRSFWVQALECINLGEGGAVQPVRYSSADGAWVFDGSMCTEPTSSGSGGDGLMYVCDPFCWLFALPGEIFRVTQDGCNTDCALPETPFGLRRKVRLGRLACGEMGPAAVLQPAGVASGESGSGSGEECYPQGCSKDWIPTECEIPVCNDGNRTIACDVVCEDAWAEAIPGTCQWLVTPGQRPMFMFATSTSSHCTSGKLKIAEPTYPDVCDWKPDPEPDEIGDDVGLLTCVDDKILAYWDDGACEYKLLAVQPHIFDHMLTAAECGEGACDIGMMRTKGKVAVYQCVDCDEEEPAGLTVGLINVVTGATVTYDDGSGETGSGDCPTGDALELSIQLTTTKICMICPDSGSGDGGGTPGAPIDFPIKMKKVEALVDAVFSCDPDLSLTPWVQGFYAFCPSDPEALDPETPCDYFDCDEGSGSGESGA